MERGRPARPDRQVRQPQRPRRSTAGERRRADTAWLALPWHVRREVTVSARMQESHPDPEVRAIALAYAAAWLDTWMFRDSFAPWLVGLAILSVVEGLLAIGFGLPPGLALLPAFAAAVLLYRRRQLRRIHRFNAPKG